MLLLILLLPTNIKLTAVYPDNRRIWINIVKLNIMVNIWEQPINRFFQMINYTLNYFKKLVNKDIPTNQLTFNKLGLIPLFCVENSDNDHSSIDIPDMELLGINYDQKPQKFNDMISTKQQELLAELRLDYQEILINYFHNEKNLPEKIDQFINNLFSAKIPIPRIIEMHIEIIDEFAKQLKLEGRSDETLLDYRLTLIEILANLCELYRCSLAKLHSSGDN